MVSISDSFFCEVVSVNICFFVCMHKLCLTAHVLKTVYEIELTLSYLEVLWGSAHTRRYNKNISFRPIPTKFAN